MLRVVVRTVRLLQMIVSMKNRKLVLTFQKDSEKSIYISYDATACKYFEGKLGSEIGSKDLDQWFLSFAKNNNPFVLSKDRSSDSLRLIRMCAEKKKEGFRVFVNEE